MSPGSEETWLFDLGNSRAKVARLVGSEPSGVVAVEWDRPDFAAALHAAVTQWPRARRVWVASVASPARGLRLRDALEQVAPARIEWLTTPRRAGGILNRYAKPERLGIDRFLAMLAAHSRTPGDAVIVGCGTALTVDAVSADGAHVEGMISLSPARMLETLSASTAIADGNPDAFAGTGRDDTAVALDHGCWASAGALVEWFIARQRDAGPAPHVWLHGGWARRLADWLAADGCVVEVFENAVLHGLAAWVAGGIATAPNHDG